MRSCSIVILGLFLSFGAKGQPGGFSAYAALGENLRPFSFRLGYNDWEVGQLNGLYGFNKALHLNDKYYSAVGFALTTTVGFYGALGYKKKLWVIPFRFELASIMDIKGLTQSGALIGVTYGF